MAFPSLPSFSFVQEQRRPTLPSGASSTGATAPWHTQLLTSRARPRTQPFCKPSSSAAQIGTTTRPSSTTPTPAPNRKLPH
eukprot:13510433-Heterocapsa_arctica.AAC.1